jgi:apolipoprotein N-acyltransferase
MIAVLAYGFWRSSAIRDLELQPGNQTISIAAIQADSPSFIPNKDTKLKTELARRIVRLGATAAGKGGEVDLIVYAESTAPMGFRDNYNPEFRAAYQVVARNSGAWLLVDNVGYTSATQHQDKKFWRECLLLNPDGEIAEVYQKRKLVPVGETLPLEQKAPWLRSLFSIGTNFVAGDGPAVLHLGQAKIAPLVCVEALYENLSRDAARAGADLLVNPANDGWFRSGKQARQHLWGAAFRAVENRTPMIRVANSGHSVAISPAGDIIGEPSPLRTEWTHVWKLNLVSRPGLFSRYGHFFTLLCALAITGNFIYCWFLRDRHT